MRCGISEIEMDGSQIIGILSRHRFGKEASRDGGAGSIVGLIRQSFSRGETLVELVCWQVCAPRHLADSRTKLHIEQMARQKFERPQKGNPHQLPIKEHVWPLKSIARFADSKGDVWLYDKVRNKARRAKPDDTIFCAIRVWDRRAELGYMKGIEDAFQELASEIIEGTVTTIDAKQKETVDAFFALWKMRADYKAADGSAVTFKSVTGQSLTRDQEETFEKNHVYFFRQDSTMPAHMARSMEIQFRIDGYVRDLSSVQWGVIHALEGHLVVPDVPAYTIIPLTPALCLCSGGQSGTITKENLGDINRSFKAASREYFFAQDLAQCP